MIMQLHLTRVDNVISFKHVSFLFLVQKKKLATNVSEKWSLLSRFVNIKESSQYFINETINHSLFIKCNLTPMWYLSGVRSQAFACILQSTLPLLTCIGDGNVF